MVGLGSNGWGCYGDYNETQGRSQEPTQVRLKVEAAAMGLKGGAGSGHKHEENCHDKGRDKLELIQGYQWYWPFQTLQITPIVHITATSSQSQVSLIM